MRWTIVVDEEYKRPDPEALLQVACDEESQQRRGKLTIYFGSAPGVGKTYAMLYDARLRKQEGKDVVVGYIETHGRAETEALLEGLEIIPLRISEYKGILLKEMDLDAILSRSPRLVLVDELAHTNAPGSRHLKRYQDVEEILNAGIDVYTTLNVQHLESLNDIVLLIQGIRVRETVPDTVFESADEVKLVDLPPEELIKRLKEGKVYVKDMAELAIRHFFQPGNLLALRELALRLAADRIDERMLQHMKAHAIAGPWATKERILVCVYASPYAEQLVRSASRLASEMNGEWTAIYVETEKHAQLSEKEQQWLTNTLETARRLGARVSWIKGDDVAKEIAWYAKNHNVTKIVIGKPLHFGLFPSLAQKIMTHTKGIDIFLFAGHSEQAPPKRKRIILRPLNYFISAISVSLISFIGFLLRDTLGQVNLLFLLLLPAILSALFFGRGPSILAAIMSIVIFDYVFVQPYYSFAISDSRYFITYIVYLVVIVIISNLASNLRYKVEQVRQSESKSTVLYELSRDLVTALNVEQVLSILVSHVRQIFPCEIAIFTPVGSRLSVKAATPGFHVDSNEIGVANWVWNNGKPAGPGTGTLPHAWAFYLPMTATGTVKGVMGFHFENPERALTFDNQVVLETIANLGALAIERMEIQTQGT
ncbi:MAG: sensor histidine kinase KdpD [Candidatus Dadabacteria bacterium]